MPRNRFIEFLRALQLYDGTAGNVDRKDEILPIVEN